MDHTISFLVGSMYDYLNNPPTIRNIVVEVPKDDTLEDDDAISKLSKDRATSEVRQALNRWYYNHKVGQ